MGNSSLLDKYNGDDGERVILITKKIKVSSVIWNWFSFVAQRKFGLKAAATKGHSMTNLLQHLKQRHAADVGEVLLPLGTSPWQPKNHRPNTTECLRKVYKLHPI